jgi:hypothetical protein
MNNQSINQQVKSAKETIGVNSRCLLNDAVDNK